MPSPPAPPKPDEAISGLVVGPLANWIRGQSLLELQALETADGDQFFPDVLPRFDFQAKTIVEDPIYLRIPTPLEMAKAKARSLRMLCDIAGQPFNGWDNVKAIAFFGADHVEHVENIVILADYAIRRRSDPTMGYRTPELLDKCTPTPALVAIMDRLKDLRDLLEPRKVESELEDQGIFWACIAAIAEKGNPSPLVGIAPRARSAFVVSMARALMSFRGASSSSRSSRSSTETASPASSIGSSSPSPNNESAASSNG